MLGNWDADGQHHISWMGHMGSGSTKRHSVAGLGLAFTWDIFGRGQGDMGHHDGNTLVQYGAHTEHLP